MSTIKLYEPDIEKIRDLQEMKHQCEQLKRILENERPNNVEQKELAQSNKSQQYSNQSQKSGIENEGPNEIEQKSFHSKQSYHNSHELAEDLQTQIFPDKKYIQDERQDSLVPVKGEQNDNLKESRMMNTATNGFNQSGKGNSSEIITLLENIISYIDHIISGTMAGGSKENERLQQYIKNQTIHSILSDMIITLKTQMMVRSNNSLTVDKTVIDALNALIELFSNNNDFKGNTEVQDLNKHLIKLKKDCFQNGTTIDFGKYGQLPSQAYKYDEKSITPVPITGEQVRDNMKVVGKIQEFVGLLHQIQSSFSKLQTVPEFVHLIMETPFTPDYDEKGHIKLRDTSKPFTEIRQKNKQDQHQYYRFVNDQFNNDSAVFYGQQDNIQPKSNIQAKSSGMGSQQYDQSIMQTMASIDNIQETTMADLDRILRKDLKNH